MRKAHLFSPAGTERTGRDLSLDASHLRPSRTSLSSAQSQQMTHCEQLTGKEEDDLVPVRAQKDTNSTEANNDSPPTEIS